MKLLYGCKELMNHISVSLFKGSGFQFSLFLVFILLLLLNSGSAQISQKDSLRLDSLMSAPLVAGSDTSVIVSDTNEIVEYHPQDMGEERGFFIFTRNNLANMRIMGSIRLNGAYDFKGLQDKDNFQILDIPVEKSPNTDPRFFMQANQSRLGLEMERQTLKGFSKLRIEGDFRGNDNAFRLRQAFGSYNNILFGQTWSNFGDVSSIPLTVDFEGPNGAVEERTIQIRLRGKIKKNYSYHISLESPRVDFGFADTIAKSYQNIPDITGSLVNSGDWGHGKVAFLYRNIWARFMNETKETLHGMGVFVGSKVIINDRQQILLQMYAGNGIARYIGSLTGRGMDVVYNPESHILELLSTSGGFIAYTYYWNEQLFSNLTLGGTMISNKTYQPATAFKQSYYSSINLFYDLSSFTRMGIEATYGARINKDEQFGNAVRVSAIAYLTF